MHGDVEGDCTASTCTQLGSATRQRKERKRKCKREGVDGREETRCVRATGKNKRGNERVADSDTKVMTNCNSETQLEFLKMQQIRIISKIKKTVSKKQRVGGILEQQ